MRVPLALAAAAVAALLLSGCSSPTPSVAASEAPPASDLPPGPALLRILAVKPSGKSPLDEAVTVANLGAGAARLAGWTLHDWDDNAYAFPDGFVLLPDSSVTIHTGQGTDGQTDLYWRLATPVWDEDDQALLRDAAGRMRHHLRYGPTAATAAK